MNINTFDYPMKTPIGTLYSTQAQLKPYLEMSLEELEREIKKPFIDPIAYSVYLKKLKL
jgi:hypothetical protein